MKALRILLAAVLALAPAGPALALDRVLPAPRIKDNGDIRLSDDLKIGRFQGGKYIATPDAVQSAVAPTIANFWPDPNLLGAMIFNVNAASATKAEGLGMFMMTSNIGAASGVGALSAYKVPLSSEMIMNAGSGNGYGLTTVLTINPGVGQQIGFAHEIDLNNFNRDYPLLGTSLSAGLLITGFATKRNTAGIYLDTGNNETSGSFMHYAAIYGRSQYLASDYFIRDESSASTALSFSQYSTHSTATISDDSTSPTGYNLNGKYSLSALYTANATTGFALIAKDGQRVCFNTSGACLYHNGSSFRFALGGTDVAQISDTGAGTFSSLTTTGLTKLGTYTFAQLPVCDATTRDNYVTVTDATTTSFNAVVNAGGSNNRVLAFCNGGGWVQR